METGSGKLDPPFLHTGALRLGPWLGRGNRSMLKLAPLENAPVSTSEVKTWEGGSRVAELGGGNSNHAALQTLGRAWV